MKLLSEGAAKTRADALEVFGPSTQGEHGSTHWLYLLGSQQFMPVDNWWLDLRFDEQGKIDSYSVRSD